MVFESFKKPNHGVSGLSFQLDVVLRNHGNLGHGGLNSTGLDRVQYLLEGSTSGDGLPMVAAVAKITAAVREDQRHQVVFLRCSLRHRDVTRFVKHPGNGAGSAQTPAVLAEGVAN